MQFEITNSLGTGILYLINGTSQWNYIGIKHGFSCINIRQVPREMLKTEAAIIA